jgi:hypothetical protein
MRLESSDQGQIMIGVRLLLRRTEDGGRQGPIFDEIAGQYRPNWTRGTPDPRRQAGAPVLAIQPTTVEPGDSADAVLVPFPIPEWDGVAPGERLFMYEGARLCGEAEVTAVWVAEATDREDLVAEAQLWVRRSDPEHGETAKQVIRLLREAPVGASVECLDAIESGCELTLLGDMNTPSPIRDIRTIFGRRIEHLKATGRPANGGDELLSALRSEFEDGLHMAVVDRVAPQTHFQLFLTADLTRLVGCIAVDQTDNPNFPFSP